MIQPRTRLWIVVLLSLLALGQAPPEPFPRPLVSWKADAANPVFHGAGGDAWDAKVRERGWIRVEDGVFHLWYTGYNDDRSPTRMLGHATSTDGVHWTRDPRNPIYAGSWVEDMCVVKDGETYVMFAEGKDDIAHSLVSPDGITWAELGPLDIRKTDGQPIAPGPRGTPAVWVENGVWNLFYERGDQGVWLARSNDRRVWTNVQDEPVLAMGPDAYDRHAVAMNQIIKRDGVYYGFYHANAHKPWKGWTTCVARSRDLIHWSKYSGNPIITNNSSSGILVDGPTGARFYTMHPEVRLFHPSGQ